jgi:hypothetical protein
MTLTSGIDTKYTRLENYDDNEIPQNQNPKTRRLSKTILLQDEKGMGMDFSSTGSVKAYPSSSSSLQNSRSNNGSIDSSYDDSETFDQEEIVAHQSQIASVHANTSRDIWVYSVCIFVNAFILEGPAAVLEGIIRAAIFSIGSIIVLLFAILCREKQWFYLSGQLIREVLLCIFAVLTLCIPGTACLVYRRYHSDNVWDLAPLPSLLGFIDSKRFSSFTFGNGSFANNVRHDNYMYDESDHNQTSIKYTSVQQQNELERVCEDSWEGHIFLEPRRLQADIIRIVRGEDILRILNTTPVNEEYAVVGVSDQDSEL